MSKEVRLLFTGDYCPGNIDFSRLAIDPDLISLLKNADAVIGNLENPITTEHSWRSDQFINLKSPPEMNPLTECFTAFSLANNHILDFGEEGARQTAVFLSSNNIGSFGFGSTPAEAALPYRFEINHRSFALFGITQWYCGTRNKSGTCSDKNRHLFRNIKQCGKNGDFVIVIPHWNYEFSDFPAPAVRRLARRLIRSGADLVAGAHPHVVNGIESIGSRKIAYSLGNLLFPFELVQLPGAEDPRLRRSIVLEVIIQPGSSRYETIPHPVEFSASDIRLMRGKDRELFLSRMEFLSSVLTSGRTAKKTFYEQSPELLAHVSSNMESIKQKQGIGSILKRLHRARTQDFFLAAQAFLKSRNR